MISGQAIESYWKYRQREICQQTNGFRIRGFDG